MDGHPTLQMDRQEFSSTDVLSTLMDDRADTLSGDESDAPSTLSASLRGDLKRFSDQAETAELLPVVAASVRHGHPLCLSVELDGKEHELALDPLRNLFSCSTDLCALPDQALERIRLRNIVQAQPDTEHHDRRRMGSLRPLLWHLALRGPRSELLPELAGKVRCRVILGTPLNGLPLDGSRKRMIDRMKFAPVSVDDLMTGTGLTRVAIQRVWNALYLQSALMVSRSSAQ